MPETVSNPTITTTTMNKKPKVLLIGWDAADWKIITPLLDSGAMPHLKALLERGALGNLATLTPILSPMLANGYARPLWRRPYCH